MSAKFLESFSLFGIYIIEQEGLLVRITADRFYKGHFAITVHIKYLDHRSDS